MAWFETWFNTPYYHILYKDRDFKEAENFILKLTQELQLPQQSKIIDLACGKGRHSLFLNELGYDVLGLDLSEESISHNSKYENATLKCAVHDMREPIEGEPVDAVFNLFTSFGFFEDPEDDRKVFRSVSGILKPGAFFVLDFLNAGFVKDTLVTESVEKKGDIAFKISRKIENDFVVKDIRFEDKGQDFHYFEKVKLHTTEEMEQYGKETGLELIRVWGDYNLNPFDEVSSPRCINLFRKI